jgi:hypothetical protein
MRNYPKIELIDTARHRNGVGGVPFTVSIFKDLDDNKTMLGIQFDSENPNDIYTAVFDLDLLKEDWIEFGRNSFRGDVYHHNLKNLTKE